jgi:hypothetical protein
MSGLQAAAPAARCVGEAKAGKRFGLALAAAQGGPGRAGEKNNRAKGALTDLERKDS